MCIYMHNIIIHFNLYISTYTNMHTYVAIQVINTYIHTYIYNVKYNSKHRCTQIFSCGYNSARKRYNFATKQKQQNKKSAN